MQGQKPSTGLPGLDLVLNGILPGDNIVWQVDSIEDYKRFVLPYCECAMRNGRRLIYFRFATHPPLLSKDFGGEIHQLNPDEGFENFIAKIHGVIEDAGYAAYYVFDCLSDLAGDWYSDQMLGNFFRLTCPYLFDLQTITFFAVFKNVHGDRAMIPIADTTQLLLEVLTHKERTYVRPIKVQHRYSPTMNLLHAWEADGTFRAETSSTIISEIRSSVPWAGIHADRSRGFWQRTFDNARSVLAQVNRGEMPETEADADFLHVLKMIFSRQNEIVDLAVKYMNLQDLVDMEKRLIGTGLVGGKTAGMLLARAIIKKTHPEFASILEDHDSFYIGSDVFYTFLVENGIWWARQKQRDPKAFLQDAERARHRILTGSFPEYRMKQFADMLDYFGQAPFIVRSSSLLEDNFGNSFAGKYDSVFCTNQGPRERRLQDFLAAIRTIYASTMSEKALHYRAQRDLLARDEQMALLVMRVSGEMHARNFYPAVAGVGFSFNPYAWNENIDPKAGVVRLVFGLGTRAVDRSDDDYTRIVALNAPERRPESNFDQVCQYAQRRVDFLDLEANQLVSGYFDDLRQTCQSDLPLPLFTSEDRSRSDADRRAEPRLVLTFDRLLSDTDFVEQLRRILHDLEVAYSRPVDIEFTANFINDKDYKINLVQCRPLQVQGIESPHLPEMDVPVENSIIKAHGAVIGQSRVLDIDNFVYVDPLLYGKLPLRDRYDVAHLLGRIDYALHAQDATAINMFLGPGRWGTSSPELGIPVTFQNIVHASVLCEIVAMREDLIPDVSLGTHFLNELVEMDMLYLALFPEQGDNSINDQFFRESPNSLRNLVADTEKWEEMVKVIRQSDLTEVSPQISLHANAQKQTVICFRK